MYTAMLTVENIAGGSVHDIWSVNVEKEYHEDSGVPGPGEDGSTSTARAIGGTGRDAPVLHRRQAGAGPGAPAR